MNVDCFLHEFKRIFFGTSATTYIQAALVISLIYYVLVKRRRPKPRQFTEREKQRLIDEFNPEPLAPEVPPDHYALNPRIVSSKYGKYIIVDGKRSLNLASHNYLGLNDEKALEEASLSAVKKYGVGTCGPRGFYGTLDIHLKLEESLAKFLDVEETIIYSYGFSAVASAIPAYSKVGDVIFCDEGVHFAIQKGLTASRSVVKFFKHNDVQDLHRLLKEQELADLKNPKKAKVTRRFLVVEGLYINHGDICPLREMIELKNKYKVRLFVDETYSFGVLGASGKGITEHLQIPIDEIDLISSSMENALSAYGGFCAGSSFIVDHQRLSGLGYCFSASLPALQAASALVALEIIEKQPELIKNLQKICLRFHSKLEEIDSISVQGDPLSPIKHLRSSKKFDSFDVETKNLEQICDHALERGYALTVARYLKEEIRPIQPSIRLIVNVRLEPTEIDDIVTMLKEAFDKLS
ncbi:serine palmitoyltransferase subunit I [Brevipalpus obovatus]|uniref:serine palmitoyltransferase subunit I n=1 Tax=Brevipalpus obovatus TaxID=246614 RepID=UPI003D9F2330